MLLEEEKLLLQKFGLKKVLVKFMLMENFLMNILSSEFHKMQITRPFEIINQSTNYDVRCNVSGGGHTGQAGAIVHGISKALVMFDEN